MNKWIDKMTFISYLNDGMSIMVGGFMNCGTPKVLIDWIYESKVKDLTIICNDAGYPGIGVGKLINNNQVSKLIASHIGLNKDVGVLMKDNLIEVELIPQGTLAERIRAFGSGLGGVLTPTGFHTIAAEGKQIIHVNEIPYVLETALGADLAIIEAYQSDALGNLTYDKTARNFNPVMALAAKRVVAQITKKVNAIDPECIITPHVLIDALMKEDTDERS